MKNLVNSFTFEPYQRLVAPPAQGRQFVKAVAFLMLWTSLETKPCRNK